MDDDLDECMCTAHEAVDCMLESCDEKDYPAPSNVTDIDISDYPEGSFVNIVEFDTEKYFHTTCHSHAPFFQCRPYHNDTTVALIVAV